ncbi:hypothetical protein V8G57_08880 [Collimonas sp. H4R21]|uniref:Uncharacterized protein n=1 Tax=Collimonas rhizosphaerae TaxID=3126357 RepID=A0ABU9PU31_9BURK
MKPDPRIRATPRPVRIAYLLEDGADVHQWLDAIFADCFGRDGGRQSLVVPADNGSISNRYQEWLRILDPDVVVVLTYDNDAYTSVLVGLLADTEIVQQARKRDEPVKNPRVGVERHGLSSISWIPFLKARSSAFQGAPDLILDCYPAWKDDGFIKDNFGTLHDSLVGFPIHEQIGMRGLNLVPKDAPDDRWHFRSMGAEDLTDGYELLDRMLQSGGVTTLSQLSNLNCQPHRPDHPWNEKFCLVIGDSFTDRVSCWNAGLLFGSATSQPYKTLRVPATNRFQGDIGSKIGNFLRKSNWIGQQNGSARIAVRSSSLTAADVQEFMAKVQATGMSNVEFEVIVSIDDCCPPDVTRIYSSYELGRTNPAIAEAQIRDPSTFVSAPNPLQLNYCAGMNPIFSRGFWLVDMKVDRLHDCSRFDNVRDVWMLPNRSQLARMLHPSSVARILRNGFTSIWTDVSMPHIEVKQPNEKNLFYSILCGTGGYLRSDMRASKVLPPPYEHSAISDKGRYLSGTLDMFGSLNNFERVLSNHFWRSQFLNMAAPARNKYIEVIDFLKARLAKNGKLVINDDAGWLRLAERVIQKSRKLSIPRETTNFEWLLADWEDELTAAIDADAHMLARKSEILADAPEDLEGALSFLFECGAFYRGHEWSCRRCSHRNWIGIAELKEQMLCEVCRHGHQLPIDLELDFRLNEFFSTCLREHDTLTVAWALCALRQESRHSFIYSPQTMLFRTYPENPSRESDRELDVVCIVDGKLLIGEAKVRVDLIRESDLADLAAAVTELQADTAILAALSGDSGLMEQKVKQLRMLLPPSIEARGFVCGWDEGPSGFL